MWHDVYTPRFVWCKTMDRAALLLPVYRKDPKTGGRRFSKWRCSECRCIQKPVSSSNR